MADRSVLDILIALEIEAGQQLAAARRIDVPGLDASTQRRQDLLFELQLAAQDLPGGPRSPEERAVIERIQGLDERLARICQSVLAILSPSEARSRTDLYGADGRLNG